MPDPSFGDPNTNLDPSQIMQMMNIQPGVQPPIATSQPMMGGMPPQGMPPQPNVLNSTASQLQQQPQQSAWKDPKQYAKAIADPLGFITQLASHGLYHLMKSIGGNKSNPLADVSGSQKIGTLDKQVAQTDSSTSNTDQSQSTDDIG